MNPILPGAMPSSGTEDDITRPLAQETDKKSTRALKKKVSFMEDERQRSVSPSSRDSARSPVEDRRTRRTRDRLGTQGSAASAASAASSECSVEVRTVQIPPSAPGSQDGLAQGDPPSKWSSERDEASRPRSSPEPGKPGRLSRDELRQLCLQMYCGICAIIMTANLVCNCSELTPLLELVAVAAAAMCTVLALVRAGPLRRCCSLRQTFAATLLAAFFSQLMGRLTLEAYQKSDEAASSMAYCMALAQLLVLVGTVEGDAEPCHEFFLLPILLGPALGLADVVGLLAARIMLHRRAEQDLWICFVAPLMAIMFACALVQLLFMKLRSLSQVCDSLNQELSDAQALMLRGRLKRGSKSSVNDGEGERLDGDLTPHSSSASNALGMTSQFDDAMGKVNVLWTHVRGHRKLTPILQAQIDELLSSVRTVLTSQDAFKVRFTLPGVGLSEADDPDPSDCESEQDSEARRRRRGLDFESFQHMKKIQEMCDGDVVQVTSSRRPRSKRDRPPDFGVRFLSQVEPIAEGPSERRRAFLKRQHTGFTSATSSSTICSPCPEDAPVLPGCVQGDADLEKKMDSPSGSQSSTNRWGLDAVRTLCLQGDRDSTNHPSQVETFDNLPGLFQNVYHNKDTSPDSLCNDLPVVDASVWEQGCSLVRAVYLSNWNFLSYRYQERTEEHALLASGMYYGPSIVQATGLRVHTQQLQGFLAQIERLYKPVPYHNAVHAADVLNSMMFLLRQDQMSSRWPLNPIARLAGFLSATIHDVGHFGRSNRYHVMLHHALAVVYNDSAPLENMHCAMGFVVLQEPSAAFLRRPSVQAQNYPEERRRTKHGTTRTECTNYTTSSSSSECLADPDENSAEPEVAGNSKVGNRWLSDEEFTELRRLTIEAVLMTDMSKHFETQSRFRAAVLYSDRENKVSSTAPIGSESSLERGGKVVGMYLKACDIGHAAKSLPITKEMTLRIHQEFFAQGDEERGLGLNISPLCDRYTTKIASSQVGFLQCLVLPLYEAVRFYIPTDEMRSECIQQIQDNMDHWLGPDPCVTESDIEIDQKPKGEVESDASI